MPASTLHQKLIQDPYKISPDVAALTIEVTRVSASIMASMCLPSMKLGDGDTKLRDGLATSNILQWANLLREICTEDKERPCCFKCGEQGHLARRCKTSRHQPTRAPNVFAKSGAPHGSRRCRAVNEQNMSPTAMMGEAECMEHCPAYRQAPEPLHTPHQTSKWCRATTPVTEYREGEPSGSMYGIAEDDCHDGDDDVDDRI